MKLFVSTVCLVVALAVAPAQAVPQAEPWDIWLENDPASVQAIDHTGWERFLVRYLRIGGDGVHRVAYGEVTPEDRAALDDYIEQLATLPIGTYNRLEQMAYWINLYNALTVRLVLDHYPIASIRDIGDTPRPLSGGPWDSKLVEINGTPVSLNDIVHRILRPIWRDPRVHYTLSCAAISLSQSAAGALSRRSPGPPAEQGRDGLCQRSPLRHGRRATSWTCPACIAGTARTSAAATAP